MALTSRALYLQGRLIGKLLPRLTNGHPFQEYTYDDGEVVSASVLGWNFGDGHSSHEQLIEAVQAQCHFEAGELRVLCVESQPLLGSTLHWRIVDAKSGKLDEGFARIADLAKRQPWDYGES
jgi:hypothetical protein